MNRRRTAGARGGKRRTGGGKTRVNLLSAPWQVKLAAPLLLALLALAAGCDRQGDVVVLSGRTMGTTWSVKTDGGDPEALRRLVEAELETVNAEASNWRDDSQISRLEAAPPGAWQPLNPPLRELLALADSIRERSDGAFDIAVAPLVRLWGFGRGAPIDAPPAPAEIERLRARTGPGCFELRTEPSAGRRLRQCSLDLSAIAKGHGVDRVFERLQATGRVNLLVEIGGEVRAGGSNPAGRPWQIGVEVPEPGSLRRSRRVLPLHDVAVATSGDYRNFFEFEGVRYSHTISPRTGWPVRHELASVTVVHPSAMHADAWATALNVLGPKRGFEVAAREGLAVLFIVRDADGYRERYTAPMAALLGTHATGGPSG